VPFFPSKDLREIRDAANPLDSIRFNGWRASWSIAGCWVVTHHATSRIQISLADIAATSVSRAADTIGPPRRRETPSSASKSARS